VTGIGEANAKKFADLGVTSVADLIQKVSKGQIKVTHHMQVGLQYYTDIQTKIPYNEVAQLAQTMKTAIKSVYSGLLVEVCGSHRRQKAMSGDIDVLITNPLIKSEDDLIKSQTHYLKNIVAGLKSVGFLVADLTSQGDTKYMGVCLHPDVKIGRRIDIRFVAYDSYYPALLYFTGSMLTNKLMRTIALEKGYTLNEYGIYQYKSGVKGEKINVNSEQEIFEILGIKYLSPTEREIN
jgi:DNA polymerase beta